MINWANLDPQRFERGVQALLKTKYPGLRSLDGSGGDGGRDAQLVTPDGLHVFEMKHFTTALNGGRRGQIVSSLKRAVRTAPDMRSWTLVIAKNMTPRRDNARTSDQSWFEDDLPKHAPGISLLWLGQAELDLEAARDMALQRYLEGADAQLLQRAKEFDREQAVLSSGADLFGRVRTLNVRAAEISLFWRWDWSVSNGQHTYTLMEKYQGAAQDDPIRLQPTFTFDPTDTAAHIVRSQLEHTLAFGGAVDVPERYISSLDVHASPETQQLLGVGDPAASARRGISIESVVEVLDPPLTGRISVQAPDGQPEASLPIHFDRRTGGARGATLSGSDAGRLLTVELTLPIQPEDHVNGTVLPGTHLSVTTRDVSGHGLDLVGPIIELLAAAQPARRLHVHVGASIELGGSPLEEAMFPDSVRLLALVTALRRLEVHAARPLHFPRDLTRDQADFLIVAVQLLDGEKVEVEGGEWCFDLVPSRVKEFLAQLPGERFAMIQSQPDATLVAGDLQIPYGPLAQHGPDLSLANREELMDHDGVSPAVARLVPNDHPFVWLTREGAAVVADAEVPGQA